LAVTALSRLVDVSDGEVLERIGTAEARELRATRGPQAVLTQEARRHIGV
jgi:hypothetical protein